MRKVKMSIFLLSIAFIALCCSKEDNVCCKTCVNGKACGDSCIDIRDTCNKAPGCACDG